MTRSPARVRLSKIALLCAVAVPALMAFTPASAKTLVYCSEGSPENFYPWCGRQCRSCHC